MAIKGLFVFGSYGGVGGVGAAAAATSVVSSSDGGKGGFNLHEEFLAFSVLIIGVPIDMVEHPLDNLFTLCCCSSQDVKVSV